MNILTIIGTRPQYVKAAPVSLALSRRGGVTETIIDTGQHFDFEMSQIFVDELGLKPPAVNLDIHGLSHARMTAGMLPPLEDEMSARKPDAVLIYGDTNSTLAAALAAAKLDIPIAHVEGGLRLSVWNPEEINRRVADTLSDYIFCPTPGAMRSCQAEGLGAVAHLTGDVMYDTLLLARGMGKDRPSPAENLGLESGGYVVMTIHRPENTADPEIFQRIVDFVRREAGGRRIVFPAHPRVAKLIDAAGIDIGPVERIKPLGYIDMARLAGSAGLIVTDSGGLQKEAYFHGVPCIVVYEETPWPELREAGWLRLWTDPEFAPRRACDAFGDGHAAERIAAILTGEAA
jgi:UDP-GlcNAc3NAcA epimerase